LFLNWEDSTKPAWNYSRLQGWRTAPRGPLQRTPAGRRPHKESPASAFVEEICAQDFDVVAGLSGTTKAYGSTAVLAFRKRDT
jgi:hypothetical protein